MEFRVGDRLKFRTLPLTQYKQSLIGIEPDKFPFVSIHCIINNTNNKPDVSVMYFRYWTDVC